MTTIAIIGAGLAGLTAAQILKDHADVTLYEKSRGLGGRMATKRAEPYFFDHGAQFFDATTIAFQNFLKPMVAEGIIKAWHARFAEIQGRKIAGQQQWNDEYPHYVGVPGMNAVGKFLSRNLDVRLGERIKTIKQDNAQWFLQDEQGHFDGGYDWVISAVPAEQSADLLPPDISFLPRVKSFKMKACFSVMLGFEEPLPMTFDAAYVNANKINWISANHSKPGRSDHFCLLVLSNNDWADEHINDDRGNIMDDLCTEASAILDQDLNQATHRALHLWRYATIGKQNGDTHLMDATAHIGVCGDWLIEGGVEAAFSSGFELAHKILLSFTNIPNEKRL